MDWDTNVYYGPIKYMRIYSVRYLRRSFVHLISYNYYKEVELKFKQVHSVVYEKGTDKYIKVYILYGILKNEPDVNSLSETAIRSSANLVLPYDDNALVMKCLLSGY